MLVQGVATKVFVLRFKDLQVVIVSDEWQKMEYLVAVVRVRFPIG